MKFALVLAEKAQFPVAWMCRILNVSSSGYYAWCSRPPSERKLRDEKLGVRVAAAHTVSRGVYGSPRVHADLQAQGEAVSRKRVARLMSEQGLTGRLPRRFVRTTDSAHDLPVAKNLLGQQFTVAAPDQVWVGDITYIGTWEGWLYLAVLVDLCSRRVIGWAMASTRRRSLPEARRAA